MHAIIDIGSNTIRLTIYKIEKGKLLLLLNKKECAGLASYVKNNEMQQEGIDKACEVLQEFYFLLSHFNVHDVFPFATAALRNVSNSKEAIAEIECRTGMAITVLAGQEEAKLGFIGATSVMDMQDGLLVDIGGGSTELVVYKKQQVVETCSINIGSLNAYDQYVGYLFPSRQERKAIKQAVLSELMNNPFGDTHFPTICGIGGTMRAAGKLNNYLFKFSSENAEIKAPNIKKMIKLLENDEDDHLIPAETLDILLKVVPDRVRTVLPGMIILHTLVKYFKSESIVISTAGVREGFLYDKVIGRQQETCLPEEEQDEKDKIQ